MNADFCRFGIEIEFADSIARYLSVGFRDIINKELRPAFWTCGTDSTAELFNRPFYRAGLELRNSEPFKLSYAGIVFDELKSLLSLAREIDCRPHKSCGVHIHFSFSREVIPFIDGIENELLRKYLRSVKYNRAKYCLNVGDLRYRPVRVVDLYESHYEARIFNGTLRIHAIRLYLNDLVSAINKHSKLESEIL